jgi:hypothetical protein
LEKSPPLLKLWLGQEEQMKRLAKALVALTVMIFVGSGCNVGEEETRSFVQNLYIDGRIVKLIDLDHEFGNLDLYEYWVCRGKSLVIVTVDGTNYPTLKSVKNISPKAVQCVE